MIFRNIMLHNIFLRKSVACICGLTALLTLSFHASATLDGRWIHHTAFNPYSSFKQSEIYKIIDGNKYVYFAVRGGNVNFTESTYYTYINKTALTQLFRYDKSKPWNQGNIEPFGSLETVKDAFPEVVEYSPRLGVFAVVYDNNSIDLIHDDGRIVYTGALKDISNASATTRPRAITFDPETPSLYLATSFGYLQIDVNTGEILKGVKLGKDVAWAARMGDRMVVIAGNSLSRSSYATTAYAFPAASPPSSLDGHEIKLSAAIPSITMGSGFTLSNFQALMPLTDKTFAAIAPSTADTRFYLVAVTLDADGNKGQLLTAQDTFDNNAATAYRQLFRTDGFWQETPDDYFINGQNYFYRIKKGVEMDYSSSSALADFKAKALTTVSKTGFASSEKTVKAASIDGKRTWLYVYDDLTTNSVINKGFYYRDISGGEWSQPSQVILPNAPAMAIAAHIDWNPKYGMMFRGPSSDGNSYGQPRNSMFDGNDLLCSYKDGVWTNRSYMANYPSLSNFSKSVKYVTSDPINPDWIWGQNMLAGMLRMDLDTYANVMMYGSTANSLKNNAGYYPVYGPQPWYNLLCNFSQASFDNEGNMWYAYHDKFGSDYDSEYYHEAFTRLNLLTPADRLSMAKLPKEGQLVMPREFKLNNVETFYDSQVLALKAPGNENLVVHTKATFSGCNDACVIYDHNGTLDDFSDDRQIKVYDLRDQEGKPMLALYEISLYEDIRSGELWINTQRGPFIVKPNEILDGSKEFRRLKISGAAEDGGDFLFDNVEIQKVVDDLAGRKWLATFCDGVFCLSEDTGQILAHFTTANSPLPSDYVLAIACDGETGSIFIGTEKGLVEFQPEGEIVVAAGPHLGIWPSVITPDFNGHINFSGAVTGVKYIIEDASGNTVKDFGTATSSRFQWDGTDNDGKPLPAGRYNIRRQGMQEFHRINILK